MKKIIGFLSIFTLALGITSYGQAVTFNPAVFTAEDEVTLTVDVTGTPMAGQAEAFIWAFSNTQGGPSKDGSSNGSWTNSNASGKMTAAGTNKWSYKFIGTALFGQSPAELKDFGFLVKAKDGSKQSSDFKPYYFDPLVFTPVKLRVFPSKADRDDVMTVNFDRTLGGNADEQRMEPTTATITMFDDANNQVGSPLTIPVRKLDANIWSASFIGTSSFTPATGRRLLKFRYKFNGTVRGATGASNNVSSSEAEYTYFALK